MTTTTSTTTHERTNIRHKRCPCCMSTVDQWRPIIYGPVSDTVVAQARRGQVVLGGLNHGRNEPRWACKRCETRFGRPREELDRFGRSTTRKDAKVAKVVPTWRLMKTMPVAAVPQPKAA